MSFSKLMTYETLTHAIAGAAGGVTAMTVFYPLDTVRSRLQVEESRAPKSTFFVMKDLIDDEGFSTLYRGLRPVLQSLCCSNFVYFYTFHGLRSLVTSENRSKRAGRDLLMASIAGIINVFLTTPLWVANSRIKMQGAKLQGKDASDALNHQMYLGLIDGIIKIAQTEGWKALWSSLVPSLFLVINPAIQFTVYESLKAEILKHMKNGEMGTIVSFLLGAISKCISTLLTYPLQHVQARLRHGSQRLKNMNMLQVFMYLIRLYGFSGLYKGLEAKLLQTVSTAALMFLCYEKIASTVFQLMGVRKNKT